MHLSASSPKYAIASVLVVVFTLIIDIAFFQKESRKKPPAHTPSMNTETELAKKSKEYSISPAQLSLVNIALPMPPMFRKIEEHTSIKKQGPKTLSNPVKKIVDKANKNNNNTTTKLKGNALAREVSSPSKQQIEQSLSQLASLDGIDRTLYFPENATKKILDYMHSCVGIDVGAVKQNNVMLFSRKNKKHSQIVRAANGFLTKHERALLAAYAPGQVLVRLYPQWFDEQLGRQIASSIGSQALTQLSGQYALQDETLLLTNIKVNRKAINKEWLLSKGC